jgi:hypothetical protein
MSSSYYVEVNLGKISNIDIVSKIEAICKYGWELNDGSCISYLPLGDKDDFDWQFVPLETKNSVLNELRKKQSANEIIGISVHYRDTDAGASLLYWPKENQISFSLTSATKLETGINDFKFYEEKLMPWIQGENIKFVSIIFSQTDSGGQIEFEKKILGDI